MKHWKVLLAVAGFILSLSAAVTFLSDGGTQVTASSGEEYDSPAAQEHEKKEQREIALRLHSDSKGKLRDDLHRKARNASRPHGDRREPQASGDEELAGARRRGRRRRRRAVVPDRARRR